MAQRCFFLVSFPVDSLCIYCHNSKSTGKETGKTHLCVLTPLPGTRSSSLRYAYKEARTFPFNMYIKNKKSSSERIFFQFMDFFLDISEAAAYLQADNGT